MLTCHRWSIILTAVLAMLGWGGVPAAAQSGTLQNLGTLGGTVTNVLGLNNLGQAVGESITPAGVFHAFLFSGGKIIDLGTLGGATSTAAAINDRGQVVGTSSLSGSASDHAFLWENGQSIDLPALP